MRKGADCVCSSVPALYAKGTNSLFKGSRIAYNKAALILSIVQTLYHQSKQSHTESRPRPRCPRVTLVSKSLPFLSFAVSSGKQKISHPLKSFTVFASSPRFDSPRRRTGYRRLDCHYGMP
ncbi:hypothetical protein EVAR_98535_1 [Eumeta japonica]|uniref:Uncharacterized protein n=1 Tax=Eumeta variegata TaxID=151549 RepID=A0A4C1YHP2_EUMVA|nr:hypothetical protein EVAR_98535_1 [Eumeta japonica]